MKKRIFASLLAICMLGTSVFAAAGDVIFSESFEIEPLDNFYVSMPEIRSYGSNLLRDVDNTVYVNGDFESGTVEGFSTSITRTTEDSRSGTRSLKIITTNGSEATTTFKANETDIVAGAIYEVEVYVKSAKPYSVSLVVNDTSSTATKNIWPMWATAGQKMDQIECSSEWQRLVSRISVGTNLADVTQYTGSTLPLAIKVNWKNVDDTTYVPVYLDDVKIRKVENAVQSTAGAQAGMPTYPIANLSGKSAQVGMYVKNATAAAKDLTLITAYYGADGSLDEVIDIYETSVPVSSAVQYIESDAFTVPAGITEGEIKIFAWDGATNLFPYTDKVDSKDVNYLPGLPERTTPLPTTDRWFEANGLGTVSSTAAGTFGNVIESGNARTGVRALYVPTVKSSSEASVVGATFPVEPGHKYKAEFYVSMPCNVTGAIGLTGATQENSLSTSAYAHPATITSNRGINSLTKDSTTLTYSWGTTAGGNKTYRFLNLNGVTAAKHWEKITIEFETPAASALADDYNYQGTYGAEDNYWETFGTHTALLFSELAAQAKQVANSSTDTKNLGYVGRGMWVDDITVTDLGPVE